MNRTYLQKYLKTNSSIQWLYMKYMQYYAKPVGGINLS